MAGKFDRYIALLREDTPELRTNDARLVEDGQYNDVVIVDGRLAFRFPKRLAHFAAAETSAALLSRVGRLLPLAVPHPTAVRLTGRAVGAGYVAYDLVPGEPVHVEVWEAVAEGEDRRSVVRQLATFLRALHGVDLACVADLAVPCDNSAAWAAMVASIRERLFQYMRSAARIAVAKLFETLLANLDYAPRLTHGDFGTSNLLFAPAAGRITGVLDFDGARLGDPATDVAALMSYGDQFMSLLVDEWPDSATLVERARLYQGTFALQEALFGLDHGDADAFNAGIAEYT